MDLFPNTGHLVWSKVYTVERNVIVSLSGVGVVSPQMVDIFLLFPNVTIFKSSVINPEDPFQRTPPKASGGRVFLVKRDVTGQVGKHLLTCA